jgi:ribosomal protein S18 acetylase RimI-like enzyme
MKPVIRPYREEDFDQVAGLLAALQDHIAALDPHGMNKSGDLYDARSYTLRMLDRAKRESGFVLVAEDAGKILGCIATRDQLEDPIDHHPSKQASVDELIVSDDARGKGIGSMLMKVIEERYKEQGYHFLRVVCFTPNVHAYRFYRKCGFEDRYTNLMKKLS